MSLLSRLCRAAFTCRLFSTSFADCCESRVSLFAWSTHSLNFVWLSKSPLKITNSLYYTTSLHWFGMFCFKKDNIFWINWLRLFLFEIYNRLMLSNKVFFISTLAILATSLHLRSCMLHNAVTSSQLAATLQNTLSQLSNLNRSIDQTISSLNPYNQTDRIFSLESAIITARKQLIQVHEGCSLPLSNQ